MGQEEEKRAEDLWSVDSKLHKGDIKYMNRMWETVIAPGWDWNIREQEGVVGEWDA